jgi:radical SAM superfamily enzyme YgiQ (UPF0313 family)
MVLAGLTPPEWDITIIDENTGVPDYASVPYPDLVGITAFTSQANRAYKIASEFRSHGVPVVMGGIHATMCLEEALERVDAVVTGEAESIWAQVLEDVRYGTLNPVYKGTRLEMDKVPLARHDLLKNGYRVGSIQTTRGCPLDCSFCSVTAFNGRTYRYRPIENVIQELKLIREKYVLIVDDNLIGTSKKHIARSKDLFRAMIRANLGKKWIAQVTINMAEDDELLTLAAKAGCVGVYIGFESPNVEGLEEVQKKFNIRKGIDFKTSIRRIHQHGILVAGSFIIGLDVDDKGIGKQVANFANYWDLDVINVHFLTPLPGTRLWKKIELDGNIVADEFPEDWKYYTLNFPVCRYKHLSWDDIRREYVICLKTFYSYPQILRRVSNSFFKMHNPISILVTIGSNLYYRSTVQLYREKFQGLNMSRGEAILKK